MLLMEINGMTSMMLANNFWVFIRFFFFNNTATTDTYPLSQHDALPIKDNRPYLLIDGTDGADEFGKIFAVAGGVIESIETRVTERFGQSDTAGERAISKNKFIPLNRCDLVVETRNRTSAEKCAGRFRRRKDRGLDLFFFYQSPERSLAGQLVIQ